MTNGMERGPETPTNTWILAGPCPTRRRERAGHPHQPLLLCWHRGLRLCSGTGSPCLLLIPPVCPGACEALVSRTDSSLPLLLLPLPLLLPSSLPFLLSPLPPPPSSLPPWLAEGLLLHLETIAQHCLQAGGPEPAQGTSIFQKSFHSSGESKSAPYLPPPPCREGLGRGPLLLCPQGLRGGGLLGAAGPSPHFLAPCK